MVTLRKKGVSLVRPGKTGADEIVAIMKSLRNDPPKQLAGSQVITVKDFSTLEEKDMKTGTVNKLVMPVTSNVLQFYTEDGTKVSVRPSGTEPKIKFYIEVHDTLASAADYDATNERAEKKIEQVAKDLGI